MTGLTVLLLLAGMALLPWLVEGVVRGALRLARRADRWWRRRRPPPPRRADRPIERLSADLRRLGVALQEIERSDQPAKVARLRATSLAYDDVLVAACRALEVEVPAAPPLRPVDRLAAEAELARHGLTW